MEIKFDDHVLSLSGLSSWKRFMLLCLGSTGAYQLTVTPGTDPTYIGGVWSMVLMGWTYYFATHKTDADPDDPPAQTSPRLKTKEEWELEIANGSGEYLNRSPLK